MKQTDLQVKNMVDNFQERGLEILYAKCDGFTDPIELQGEIPDVIGWEPNKQLLHVGLIENIETNSPDKLEEKIKVLAKLSMSSGHSQGEHVPFYFGIDKDAKDIENIKNDFSDQYNIVKIRV